MKTVIFSTGGSGGHIYPALGLAHMLKKDYRILFMGSFKGFRVKIEQQGFPTQELQGRGLQKKTMKDLIHTVIVTIVSLVKAYQAVKKSRPELIVGFGGYGSLAPVMAAFALRVPICIHEQNVYPGRANRFLAVLADRVAVSFSESLPFFDSSKTTVTGCPVHVRSVSETRDQLFKKWKLDPRKPVVLILGGSQGSFRINSIWMRVCRERTDRGKWQIIHVSGLRDLEQTKRCYQDLGFKAVVHDFIDNIEEAYILSDCVVSRAGASTLAEIALLQKCAVLIPYPHANDHQKKNAQIIGQRPGIEVIIEDELSVESLSGKLAKCLSIAAGRKEQVLPDKVEFSAAGEKMVRLIKELSE